MRKDIVRIVLYGIGLGSLASVIYFAGPLIAFGDWHPLENPIVRDIALVLLVGGRGESRRLRVFSAAQGRQGDRRWHRGEDADGQRRAGAQGAHEGRARDAEDRQRQQVRLSL